jgi:hypothetical protein
VRDPTDEWKFGEVSFVDDAGVGRETVAFCSARLVRVKTMYGSQPIPTYLPSRYLEVRLLAI